MKRFGDSDNGNQYRIILSEARGLSIFFNMIPYIKVFLKTYNNLVDFDYMEWVCAIIVLISGWGLH